MQVCVCGSNEGFARTHESFSERLVWFRCCSSLLALMAVSAGKHTQMCTQTHITSTHTYAQSYSTLLVNTHLHTHTHTDTHTLSFSFFKGATQICIIWRASNFQPVSYSYFNKATNQWWFGSSTGALLRLWHFISCFHPLSLLGFTPRWSRLRGKKESKRIGEETWWRTIREKSGKEVRNKGRKKENKKERKKDRKKEGANTAHREKGWWMAVEPGVGSGWLGVTAECKVPAAAVDVPTEGGCGVSGPFDYEYANAARHESKASRGKRERAREREKGGMQWTER